MSDSNSQQSYSGRQTPPPPYSGRQTPPPPYSERQSPSSYAGRPKYSSPPHVKGSADPPDGPPEIVEAGPSASPGAAAPGGKKKMSTGLKVFIWIVVIIVVLTILGLIAQIIIAHTVSGAFTKLGSDAPTLDDDLEKAFDSNNGTTTVDDKKPVKTVDTTKKSTFIGANCHPMYGPPFGPCYA